MVVHLGQEVIVYTKDIIGIFDLENTSVSKFTRAFLTQAQKSGRVVNVTEQLPKSFVVCTHGREKAITVYISQIAPATLRKRADFL